MSMPSTIPSPRRRAIGFGLATAAFGWSAPLSAQDTTERPKPAAPGEFAATTPLGRLNDGNELTLGELHPRAVVVCFWASWCPHCRNELVALERVQKSVAPEQLRVVMVNTEDSSDWRRIRRQLEGQLSMLLTSDAAGHVGRAFVRPNSVPYTVVIGRDGGVQGRLKGWSDDSLPDLIQNINDALAAKPRAG
jgi:thiol-disulfide isomerase/thioredoxin